MGLYRSFVEEIGSAERAAVLEQFGIDFTKLIARGTEAEVYLISDSRLLKLYGQSTDIQRLQLLKSFYELVDSSEVSFQLPRILEVAKHRGLMAVVESNIPGKPLADLLPELLGTRGDEAVRIYFDTVSALSKLRIKGEPQNYRLFDPEGRSATSKQSWGEYFSQMFATKAAKLEQVLSPLIPDYQDRHARLADKLGNVKLNSLSVVHGDFFPGNILVAENASRVSGVIDFGSFTHFGDPVLDLAGAFGYFRMYERDRAAIRVENEAIATGKIPESLNSRFFAYLLANALLTSDLYATSANLLEDGHFQWALEILQDDSYWQRAFSGRS